MQSARLQKRGAANVATLVTRFTCALNVLRQAIHDQERE
jgi:hypothetical protein